MSLKEAMKNGIKRSTYYARINELGWDKQKAMTTPPLRKPAKRYKEADYTVYKNDEIVAVGSLEECAKKLKVTEQYIRWLATPSGKKRLEKSDNPNNIVTAVRIYVDD